MHLVWHRMVVCIIITNTPILAMNILPKSSTFLNDLTTTYSHCKLTVTEAPRTLCLDKSLYALDNINHVARQDGAP